MPVLAVAHRAGNDPAALASALALGVDVIEADVRPHRDGPLVRHDPSRPWRNGDDGPMRLPALLASLPAGTTVMLDLKGVGRVGGQVRQALAVAPATATLWVCGRWWPDVEIATRTADARPVLSAGNRRELALLRRRLRRGRAPYGVAIAASLLTPAVAAELRGHVEQLLTWPIDDAGALDRAVRCGATGVISSVPEVLRSALATRSG